MKRARNRYFTYATQNTDNHVDKPNMEHGHDEMDRSKVSGTCGDVLATRLADFGLGRDAQSPVEHAIHGRFSVRLVEYLPTP